MIGRPKLWWNDVIINTKRLEGNRGREKGSTRRKNNEKENLMRRLQIGKKPMKKNK